MGFRIFRTRIAAACGISIDQMQGYDGNIPWSEINDDIVPLLDHSDCDGWLTAKQCKRIAPRLQAILNLWPDDDYDKARGMMLVRGMKKCAKLNKKLLFS